MYYHWYNYIYIFFFLLIFLDVTEQQGSIVVCVSPLTSLMMDQKNKFSLSGITTEIVSEDQIDKSVITLVIKGDIQLVYIMVWHDKYYFTVNLIIMVNLFSRRDQFRTAFAHLGDIRSILSSNVNILSLTATATTATFNAVCKQLSISNPVVLRSWLASILIQY